MSDPIFDPFAAIREAFATPIEPRATFNRATGRIEASIPISPVIAQRMIEQGDGDLIEYAEVRFPIGQRDAEAMYNDANDVDLDSAEYFCRSIDTGERPLPVSLAQWRTLCGLIARDIYLHRVAGVWSPFTREIEDATVEWLEGQEP